MMPDYGERIDYILQAHREGYDRFPDRDDNKGDEFIQSLITQRHHLEGQYDYWLNKAQREDDRQYAEKQRKIREECEYADVLAKKRKEQVEESESEESESEEEIKARKKRKEADRLYVEKKLKRRANKSKS
jgi:hypothetical protein